MQQGPRAARRTECNAAAVDQGAADQSAEPAQAEEAAAPLSREEHNRLQAEAFSDAETVEQFLQPLEVDVFKLQRIAGAVPGLGPESRVIDVGSGTGVLIQHLQARGVRDILAVDLAQPMLDALERWHPPPGTLGNDPGVRTWCGDIVDVPAAQGPADAVFFNACFGNVHDQHAALWAACRLLRPGGHIVVSHPLGRDWCDGLSQRSPEQVPHSLPDADEMERLVHDLPLRAADDGSGPDDMYLRVLQVPEGYVFDNMFYDWQLYQRNLDPWRHKGIKLRRKPRPLYWKAEVVQGFGRGSRDLGFPTANLDPADCRSRFERPCFDLGGDPAVDAITPRLWQMPNGVYFGFAKLLHARKGGSHGLSDADLEAHAMVLNIGRRPTMADGGGVTVEVHVFDHKFTADFYGMDMSVLICGFLRPEINFNGLPALMAQIRADIGIARAQLAMPQPQMWKEAKFTPKVRDVRARHKAPKPAPKPAEQRAAEQQAAEQQAGEQAAAEQRAADSQEHLRDRLPADVFDKLIKIKVVENQLNAQPERQQPVTLGEIATAMGRAERGLELVVRRACVANLVLDLGISAEDAAAWGFGRLVELAVRELQFRQNEIIRHRYGTDEDAIGQRLTVEQVAKLYNMTEREVRQAEAKAKAGLKEMLDEKIAIRKEQQQWTKTES